jgi:hypothetical protein
MRRRLMVGIVSGLLLVARPIGATPAPAREVAPPAAPRAVPGSAPADRVRIEVGACVLEAPPEQRASLESLARRAQAILPRIEAELQARPVAPYRIVLIPPGPSRDPELRQLDAAAPPWAAGFLLPALRIGAIRIALADRYPHGDLASVLAHEATHMLLHDAAGGDLPRWFGEGVATAIERSWGLRDILVYSSSLLAGPLPALSDLDAAFETSDGRARVAYAASFDFLAWSERRYGPGLVRRVVREAADLSFPEAWECAAGTALARSESEWRRGSLLLYRWVPALTGTTAVWTGIAMLALLAGARRRARSRAILRRWEDEEGAPRGPMPGQDEERPPRGPAPDDRDGDPGNPPTGAPAGRL